MRRATNNDMIHLHCHTDGSNLRLQDSNIKVNELIDYAYMLGNNGVAITDHECLSEHVSAINYVNELKNNNKITQDFKLILGNEIYLMNKNDLKQKLEDKDKIKFYHCLLLAKDKIGHQQLRQLSSRAWRDNYINYKGMARVPTYYSDIEDIIGENKGHVIMLTACLGSYLGEQSILLSQTNDEEEIYNIKMNMSDYIEWAIDVFGNDLYLEMQPNKSEEQVFYNKLLVDISKGYDIPLVVTTDVHYLDETTREMHKAFLTSDDEDSNREVDYFYDTTHFFKVEDIYNNMDYLDEDIVTKAILTTKDIANKIESYDWFASPKIPLIPLPPKQEWFPIDSDLIKQYPNIEGVYKDNYEHHTYLIHQIFKGIEEHNIPKEELNDTLSRVDLECSEIIGTSEVLNEPVGAYLVTMQKNVDLIWEVSCVGAGRGSAVGWVIDYLLGITQINPIKQDGMKLQHWRFLNSERVTFPDIDIDYSSHLKNTVFKKVKEYYQSIDGNCVRVATFKTETSKSAILTACRGLGINSDIAKYISSLVTIERGKVWSINDMYYGNPKKNREPVQEFINIIDKYSDLHLLEAILSIEGLKSGLSSHASGVLCLNEPLENTNSYMRTPSGELVTAYDLHESEQLSNVKFDFLLTNGISLIQLCIEMLVKAGYMEWQGSLRKTYDKYLLPEVIDMKSEEIWNDICQGKIMNLFQFETPVGKEAIRKLQPHSLLDLANANSLMRLSNPNGEQPLDKYIRFKNNPELWEQEMIEWKLTEEERKIMHEELDNQCGVCSNQESLMELVRNSKIANFSIKEADMLRKAIAKKDNKVLEEVKTLFYNKGEEVGTSINLLNYIWEVQVKYQEG